MKSRMIYWSICITFLTMSCSQKQPEFAKRFDFGITPYTGVYPSPGSMLSEDILVKNSPQDTIAIAKMIINYATDKLRSLDEVKKIDTLYTYDVGFHKYSARTMERLNMLWENRTDPYYYLNHKRELPEYKKTDFLGSFHITKFKDGYEVYVFIETGITGDYENPEETRRICYTLYSERDNILNCKNEIIHYYNQLQREKVKKQ